ncbi:MAG TPA: hypothetical protein VEW68_03600 [Patescibacteria group bacterium]|nr:hypothetical protein [Patescibacteria group bacterium]
MAAEATVAAEAPPTEATAAPVAASPEPRTPAPGPSPAAAKAGKAKKAEKAKKGAKGSKAAEPAGDGPSVAAHPRAARGVAQAKSWGGLAGFLLGGYLSLPTNTIAGAGLRALLAGVVCYVAVWAGAVFLWRRLVILEIKGREQQLLAAALKANAGESPASSIQRPGARAAS